MKKLISILIILITIIWSGLYFIKYNVKNNTSIFYEYKRIIPKSLKADIRKFLTNIKSLYIYNTKNFKFSKRISKNLTNADFDDKNLSLYTNTDLIFTGPRAYISSNKNFFFNNRYWINDAFTY